ncbi:MAG TPA: coproporphyrinogen III oxidase, partial [Sulfuricurvum sp.]|nr:coproporphyrinogen III oxidase [Sulfuricurvum sp.]
VGIGSGAFSFIGDTLYANTFSLPAYAAKIGKNELPITHATTFPPRAIRQYRMMVEMFGLQPSKQHLWIESTLLKMCGMVENDHVNERGAHLFSVMMREFYNGMDYVRETMRKDLTKEDGLIR